MSAVLLAIAVGLTQSGSQALPDHRFPDTPANHWAYQAMADLHSIGIAPSLPVFIGRGGRTFTRFEITVCLHASYTSLHSIVLGLKTSNESIAHLTADHTPRDFDAKEQSIQMHLKTLQPLRSLVEDDLVKLTALFSADMKTLGVDIKACIDEIHADCSIIASLRLAKQGEALHQFADVPENHWAAKATKDLRAEGILVGYPDGRFRG